jgi:diacylglycerol kinase family enzyme
VSFLRATSATFEGDRATRVHLDGEPFGELPVRIGLVPKAIEVAAPMTAATA